METPPKGNRPLAECPGPQCVILARQSAVRRGSVQHVLFAFNVSGRLVLEQADLCDCGVGCVPTVSRLKAGSPGAKSAPWQDPNPVLCS